MSNRQNRMQIAFHRPSISNAEIAAVTAVLRSGWLTTGTQAASFEAEFAAYTGARHAICVNSCTAGLHLALLALGVGRGDEVITTPYTFAATGETIIHCGARPVLVDVEEKSANIDPGKIARAITPQTRAIVPVHIAGDPCRLDEINRLAARHHLGVVEDAAHALGGSYRGRRIGGISTVTVFSFYATKNLTTGEGGMVTTNSDDLARRIRQLSLHGLTRDAWNRYTATGSWRYEICEPGWKYNLSDLQAAIGRVQLERFDQLQRRRRRLVRAYREGLQECRGLILPREAENGQHAWHLFIIRLRDGGEEEETEELAAGLAGHPAASRPAVAANPAVVASRPAVAANPAVVASRPAAAANPAAAWQGTMDRRDRLIEQLRAAGIGTSVHFIPLHLHRCYQQAFGYRAGDFPNAERLYAAAISLPLYPGLRPSEVEYICRTVRRLMGDRRHHPVTEGVVAS